MADDRPGGAEAAGAEAAADDATGRPFAELAAIMRRLRSPEGGCPWDRQQTRDTLKSFILEEAHEVVEAIDHGDPAKIVDELGDLLMQVVFQAEIGRERGEFDLADVARAISRKLVRRHPHVFGDPADAARARTPAEVEARWDELKKAERAGKDAVSGQPGVPSPKPSPGGRGGEPERAPASLLDGVPAALPALVRAQRLQERAARVGFDWARREDVEAKVDEEWRELREAISRGDRDAAAHELGDLLFALVNLGRFLRFEKGGEGGGSGGDTAALNAEDVLRAANRRFASRFRFIELEAAKEGRELRSMTLAEMDRLWDEAKRRGL